MSFLELQKVEKYYGEHHAIKGIDLNIEPGEFIVFVGPSGCGKSTLLRMIAGLEVIVKANNRGHLCETVGTALSYFPIFLLFIINLM